LKENEVFVEDLQSRILQGIKAASETQDFIDLHAVVEDETLQDAIDLALKCIVKPDVPVATAKKVMLQMQGFAFKFKMQGLVYMQIHKGAAATKENIKKNAYFYASEQCHELAQTLKYLSRENTSF
jgi:hypothetical protein